MSHCIMLVNVTYSKTIKMMFSHSILRSELSSKRRNAKKIYSVQSGCKRRKKYINVSTLKNRFTCFCLENCYAQFILGYIYIGLPTVVNSVPMASSLIAATLKFKRVSNSFLAHDPCLIMLSVKQGGIKYHFWVIGMIRHGIEPRSPGPSVTIYKGEKFVFYFLCKIEQYLLSSHDPIGNECLPG